MANTLRPSSEHDLLIDRLDARTPLSIEERLYLQSLPMSIRTIPSEGDLFREGDAPAECCLVLSGLLFRYRLTETGARQILSFHVPGDLPDLQSFHMGAADHSLGALARSRVALIPHSAIQELMQRFPDLASALWQETLVEGATFREWITNVGHRSAYQRLAHLMCELTAKLRASGLPDPDRIPFPLSQQVLADATGLSVVHVNRTLQRLRGDGYISLRAKVLTICDWDGLRAAAGFDPAYLHLRRARAAPQLLAV